MNIFEKHIAKVEQDLTQLRLRYRNEPHNRTEIEKLAKERTIWLNTLKKSAAFWQKTSKS